MIRDYQPSDLDTLLSVFHDSVHELGRDDYTEKQLEAWAPSAPDREAWSERLSHGRTFVAERKGQVAGFTRIENSGYVDLLYVSPNQSGQGIGMELLRHATAVLAEEGATRVWAHASHTARPVFERAGFHAIARQGVTRQGVALEHWSMVLDLD